MKHQMPYEARPRRMRYEKKQKKNVSGIFLSVMILITLFLMAGAFSFWFFGGVDILLKRNAEPGYRVDDTVQALRINAPQDMENSAMQQYFSDAVAFAEQEGYNTVMFEAKTESAILWRDDIFPTYPEIAAQGSGVDPLEMLCDALEDKEIQLLVEVDMFAVGGEIDKTEEASLTEMLSAAATQTKFSPQDSQYTELAAQSIASLPLEYSIGGIVFSGFDSETLMEEQEKEQYTAQMMPVIEEIHTMMADEGRLMPMYIAYDGANDTISSGVVASMIQSGLLTAQFVSLPDVSQGQSMEESLAALGPAIIMQHMEEDTSGIGLFMAQKQAAYQGFAMGEYPAAVQESAHYSYLKSVMNPMETEIPTGFEVGGSLEITYPTDGRNLTWEGVYMTGHSNPSAALIINGVEITNRASGGAFGVYVPLVMGENVFSIQNGDVSASKTITRIEPTTTTSYVTSDGSSSANAGQVVEMVRPYVNVLTDPSDVYSINEVFNLGAKVVVQDAIEVQSGTTERWAYQLSSGDWIWATNVSKVSGDGASTITGLSTEAHEKGEYIVLEGTGTPAAYIAHDEESKTLKLTFYDTSISIPEGFSSELVSSATVESVENSMVLSLQTNNMWGYNIEYENDQTKLFLKRAPKISDDPDKPLSGVHVMLDPGHGDQTEGSNYGAVGIAGETGYPHEQHINLMLADATAWRLEQLGATVTYTKTSTENPGINDRFIMQNAEKPDFFISIHHDGLDGNVDLSDMANLLSIYYHPYNIPPSEQFADNLLTYVSRDTGLSAEEEPRWGSVNYGVIRTTVCPSVLFEYGLLVHPGHYEYNTSTEGIWTAAFATADAIMDTIPK